METLKLNFYQEETFNFELVVAVRNPKTGEPTGKTKRINTDDAGVLAQFWNANKGKSPKKKKGTEKGITKMKKGEADKIARTIGDFCDKLIDKREAEKGIK